MLKVQVAEANLTSAIVHILCIVFTSIGLLLLECMTAEVVSPTET